MSTGTRTLGILSFAQRVKRIASLTSSQDQERCTLLSLLMKARWRRFAVGSTIRWLPSCDRACSGLHLHELSPLSLSQAAYRRMCPRVTPAATTTRAIGICRGRRFQRRREWSPNVTLKLRGRRRAGCFLNYFGSHPTS